VIFHRQQPLPNARPTRQVAIAYEAPAKARHAVSGGEYLIGANLDLGVERSSLAVGYGRFQESSGATDLRSRPFRGWRLYSIALAQLMIAIDQRYQHFYNSITIFHI
jgi:hypothetical protein